MKRIARTLMDNPEGNILCSDCILTFLFETNNCALVIDQYYETFCGSSRCTTIVPFLYFVRWVLSYPLVARMVLSKREIIEKLLKILIFYLKEIDLDTLTKPNYR